MAFHACTVQCYFTRHLALMAVAQGQSQQNWVLIGSSGDVKVQVYRAVLSTGTDTRLELCDACLQLHLTSLVVQTSRFSA